MTGIVYHLEEELISAVKIMRENNIVLESLSNNTFKDSQK